MMATGRPDRRTCAPFHRAIEHPRAKFRANQGRARACITTNHVLQLMEPPNQTYLFVDRWGMGCCSNINCSFMHVVLTRHLHSKCDVLINVMT